jgi:hypothetical protein
MRSLQELDSNFRIVFIGILVRILTEIQILSACSISSLPDTLAGIAVERVHFHGINI